MSFKCHKFCFLKNLLSRKKVSVQISQPHISPHFFKGKKLWSIQLSANATSLLLIPLLHQSTTLMAVALEGGTICFYNGREMVDTIMAADTIAGMIFGRFGQEEHCLVLLTVGKY